MPKTIGNFTFHETSIEGVYKIDVKKYGDNRGYFEETYKESDFIAAGITNKFIQDNQSKSKKGVLRGLHFQKKFPQAKLVRCIEGEVFDVAVDLRKGSKTYGKWEGVILSAEKGNQFMIPRGFAHGFVVLSETATFCYKCDELYHPEDEGGIMWNDAFVGIEWPEVGEILLSEKDKKHLSFNKLRYEYEIK
ncbi:MAG: dTDP-4-dehydrorhamnose 3,5-epimerase [Bacillales bacterium]|nr:dTDP-4-dehydrorhamnose 3,5-epimerase [Bacillales bacterium]